MNANLEGHAEALPGQRRIRPAVLVLLDAEVGEIGSELVVQLSHVHPDAVAFVTAVQMGGVEGEPRRRRLLRVAMETVTDVVARREALARGYAIDDTLRVFLLFSAAAQGPPAALSTALQTLHQVAAECFDQTRLEVHALTFLPDLGDPASRELLYRDAYLRLLELDEIGSTGRALGARTHSSFDFRWFVDSRTRSGGHAGGLDDVQSPVAKFLATLLDGRDTGTAEAAARAREQLRSTARGRHTAYSTFGLAVYFHYPRLVLRALAADAAALYLAGYLGTRTAQGGPPAGAPLLASLVGEWSSRIRGELAALIDSRLRERPQLDGAEVWEQERQRGSVMDLLRSWAEPAIREVLATGGIPLARRVLSVFGQTSPPDDPAEEDAVSVGTLRRDVLRSARDLLRYDMLAAHEAERRAALERLREDFDANPAALEAAERDVRQASALRGRADAVLDAAARPDEFERELVSLQNDPGVRDSFPSPILQQPEVPPGEGEAASHGSTRASSHAPAPTPARKWSFGGLLRRLIPPPLPAERKPSGWWKPRRGQPRHPDPPSPPGRSASNARVRAWHLAEQLRAIDGIERLVARLLDALRQHDADVANTANGYARDRDRLRTWLTEGNRFSFPAIGPLDFDAYAERYVAPIEERLARAFDRRRLAGSFAVEPRGLARFESPLLARFPGFQDALDEAAGAVGAPLEEEDLLTILRRHPSSTLRGTLTALADNAQPLGRPGPAGDAPAVTHTALYAHERVFELLRHDPAAGGVLAEREVDHVDTLDTLNLVLCSSLHGFSAHDLRKVLLLRGRTYDQDGALPSDVADLVPLDAGRRGEGREIFEVVVLARALGVLEDGEDPETGEDVWTFDGHRLPADLLRTIGTLLYSLAHRGVQPRLDRAVDALLARPEGIERVRAAAASRALLEAEREWLFDVLAEFETHSTFTWRNPVFGEEGNT